MIIFPIVCPPWQPEECLLTYPRYRPPTGQYLSIRILNSNEVMKDKINRSVQVKSYCKIRIINAIGRASCVLRWQTGLYNRGGGKPTFLGYPLLLSRYDMASSTCLQKSISCQHSCYSKPIHTWITEYTRTRCYFQCLRNLLVLWTLNNLTQNEFGSKVLNAQDCMMTLLEIRVQNSHSLWSRIDFSLSYIHFDIKYFFSSSLEIIANPTHRVYRHAGVRWRPCFISAYSISWGRRKCRALLLWYASLLFHLWCRYHRYCL